MLLVWIVGFGFDRMLAKDGVTRTDLLLTSNFLTELVAGFLFFSLRNNERLRRKLVRDRLRTIAEMNYHIRNALQVITYATASKTGSGSVEMVRNSVERIEWALREMLPGRVTSPDALLEKDSQEEAMRLALTGRQCCLETSPRAYHPTGSTRSKQRPARISDLFFPLPNTAKLVGNGEITVGVLRPIGCVATACSEDSVGHARTPRERTVGSAASPLHCDDNAYNEVRSLITGCGRSISCRSYKTKEALQARPLKPSATRPALSS